MPENGNRKKIICIADDDEDDRMLLHEALLELDRPFEILEVCGAEQLLRQFSKSKDRFPDVIFLDLYMPVMDGFEFIEALRRGSVNKEAKIIAYSVERSRSAMERAFALGADFYAVKPSSYSDLKKLAAVVMEASWDALTPEQRIFHAAY